jgi:hypothetical protein
MKKFVCILITFVLGLTQTVGAEGNSSKEYRLYAGEGYSTVAYTIR